jgi:protein TonB
MSSDRTQAVEPEAASDVRHRWVALRSRATRSLSERCAVLAVIGLVHVLAIGALWTRNQAVEPEPEPLTVSLIAAVVPLQPSRPMLAYLDFAPPPITIAPPARLDIAEDAPAAITVREVPSQPPPAAPGTSTVTEARFDVDYLNNPKPAYPPISRRLREEGVVVLKVNVRADGSVAQALVEKHSGSVRLDDAALSAVKRWHFVPARRGQEPVESWVLVPIEFELQS